MKFVTSWDDGNYLDLRLAKLLKSYGLKGIFYIPNNCQLTESEIKVLANVYGMEIGGHTVTHPPDIKLLDRERAGKEITRNRKWLQQLTGQSINSFAYPRGRYNEETIELVKEAGFSEARTTQVFHLSSDNPLTTHTTIHAHPSRTEYDGAPWYLLARKMFKQAGDDDVFHLWGHADEIERYKMWHELEAFLRFAYENLRPSKN